MSALMKMKRTIIKSGFSTRSVISPELWDQIYQEITTVLDAILDEKSRAREKWGGQNYNIHKHISIVTEELGEVAQAALQMEHEPGKSSHEKVRYEAVQAAAMALELVERIDRGSYL